MHAFAAEVNFGNQFFKEMRIGLCALIVVRADVLKISAISEGVLGDDVHIASIKIRVPLVFRRSEALTENKIGGAKSAGIRSAKENGVLIHFRIDVEGRREHIMTVPITKEVVALFVLRPVVQGGPQGQQAKGGKRDQNEGLAG